MGAMDGWTVGQMDGWVDKQTYGWTVDWTHRWTDAQLDRWMCRYTDRRLDGQTDGWRGDAVTSPAVTCLPCRQMLDTEDELREMRSDAVPSEVRDWLAATFTQQARAKGRRAEEKPKFRSIVHAVQAGIFVERWGWDGGGGGGGLSFRVGPRKQSRPQ